ncbi:beta-trefoil DNA-binding domain-containing protein [Phycomyces nitens]|nr:beta-trefoil DNA-binding domain-containing protein [Phycomyces nitens]
MNSTLVSQEVFGSSKKIQFLKTTSMDSLLSAIDSVPRIKLPQPSKQTMSIEAILDTNGNLNRSTKRAWSLDTTDSPNKIHRPPVAAAHSPPVEHCAEIQPMATITCLHAAVAQKSYGSEKRFLCPPPVVTLKSSSTREAPVVSMSVVCESIDRPVEQRAALDDQQSGSFKYLHVTGTAKSKQFCLRVGLSHAQFAPLGSSPHQIIQPFATFFSAPVAIISKPSKKTAKARNVSTCILANSPVSLFNRINSQTVRTKYMSSDDNRLCAKSSAWSAFSIQIIRQPADADNCENATPVLYGTEIILKDTQTGVSSPALIVRKVDKGCIAATASGPISQMQKIALQIASSLDSQPTYLSAAGNIITPTHPDQSSPSNQNANAWLDIAPSQPSKTDPKIESVDDYLCWTIVSIAKFEYTFADPLEPGKMTDSRLGSMSSMSSMSRLAQPSPPPSPPRTIVPYPSLTFVEYNHSLHCLDVTGHHLLQATSPPRLLEFWLGNHGPLKHTNEALLRIELPPTQDLLVSNHNILQRQANGDRHLELPLVLVRQDGMVYPTGKSLSCAVLANGDASRWFVVPTHSHSLS